MMMYLSARGEVSDLQRADSKYVQFVSVVTTQLCCVAGKQLWAICRRKRQKVMMADALGCQ